MQRQARRKIFQFNSFAISIFLFLNKLLFFVSRDIAMAMKKYLSFTIIIFLIFFSKILIAQNSETDSTTSHFLIEKGIGLHDEGEYDDAIKLFNNVSACDPNYWWACYESALSYYDLGKLDIALSKCHESDELNPDNVATVALIGSIMDETGQTIEAISYLKKALETWPYNQNLLYNLAVCYTNADKFEEAEEVLIRSIRINPYHKTSNLLFAKVNFYMGRVAQSYLAYNMAILLNPRVSYINEYEKAISGKIDSLSHPLKYPYPAGTDHRKWDELKWFLNSEMSFNNEFEYDYKVSYITLRQSLILFRKMSFDPSDTSIYNQFYVRFYSEMMKNNYFETYLNYSFKNTDNKLVAEWVEKNQDKLDEFIKWAQTTLSSYKRFGFSTQNEINKVAVSHYNSNGNLQNIGKQKTEPSEVKYGEWLTLNSDGGIDEKGPYLDNSFEGEWQVYWPNGKVKQHIIFHADKLDGNIRTYHPNGAKAAILMFVKGKKEGLHEEFLTSGRLFSRANYVSGKPDGKNEFYFFNQGYKRESYYVEGKTEGKITEHWLNGVLKSEVTAKDSLFEGPYYNWYASSKPESEGFCAAGVETGKWAHYYPNGDKKSEGEYNDNEELTGTRTSYFRNGKIQSKETAYTDGVLNGTVDNYFEDGAIQTKRLFKDDKQLMLECFDASGKTLFTSEESNGAIRSRTYYADGTLETDGILKDGIRDGRWLIYDPLGRIVQELMYKDGFQSGAQKKYHGNGFLKEEYSCDSNNIIGVYKEYFASGNLETSGLYNKNGRAGEWTSYYSNDTVQSKLFYTDDVRVGRQFFYSPTGNLSSDEYFNDEGLSIRIKLYDENEKIRQDQKYEYDSVLFNEYYPSGKLRIKKTIVNNVQHGISETYLPNGKLQSLKPYLFGLTNGIGKRWDYKGNLEIEVPYVMGKISGMIKGYEEGKLWYTDFYEDDVLLDKYNQYYSNGKLSRCITYSDNLKHGTADYFAPDSSLMYRFIFQEDVLKAFTYKDSKGNFLPEKPVDLKTTEIVSYYSNGKISARMALKNGEMDGVVKTYYPNGKPMAEKLFVKGNFEGPYKEFHENGNLKELINYHNGERDGKYELYSENGKKQKEGQNICGQDEGEWHIYNEAGKLVNTLYYYNDEIYDIK